MSADTDTAQAMSAEQAADFAALQAGATGGQPVPGAEPLQQEQGQGQPSPQAMQAAGMLVGMILRPLGSAISPGLREAPDELWGPPVEGFAGLLDHYDIAEKIGGGPWMTFAMSVAPLVGIVVIERMQAAEKPKAPELTDQSGPNLEAPQPQAVAGSKTVTFGGVAA